MTAQSETQILCEGFHDRAFWDGWLLHLQCSNEGYAPGTAGFPQLDPWGLKIGNGHYAYLSRGKQFIRVVPCHGRAKVLPAVRDRLKTRAAKILPRLIVNVDPDTSASPGTAITGLRVQDVLNMVQQDDAAAKLGASGEIEMDSGATRVYLIRWVTPDPPAPGVPDQQTLERLICAALAAAYPARAANVDQWLRLRADPPVPSPKEHSWSYMAGWFAEYGCNGFFQHLWADPAIVRELESRLRTSGAWQLVDLITQ